MQRKINTKLIYRLLLVTIIAFSFSNKVQANTSPQQNKIDFASEKTIYTAGNYTEAMLEQENKPKKSIESSFINEGKTGSLKNKSSVENTSSETSKFLAKEKDFQARDKVLKVVPGGQSVGIKITTPGVLVVGHHQINTKEGKTSPAADSGIKVGDMITEINGVKVTKINDVTKFLEQSKDNSGELNLLIRRDNESFNANLQLLKDKHDQTYKLGLYIRDTTSGIGTMTFYDPNTKRYGALGHVISDADTKKPISIDKGKLLNSTIMAIEKGTSGNPGEKLARFSSNKDIIGDINKNSPYGIFGKLNNNLSNGIYDQPLPVGDAEKGPAEILTVVKDNLVNLYDIEIVETTKQDRPSTKGMVIKITDEKLLEETGGIIQGMSGSPIIQNGHIVGAITHVFVKDPAMGYGIHLEWMLEEVSLNKNMRSKLENLNIAV